jgi:molybdopterin/thiamine biosynthesis adenylyltransferase
MSSLTNQTNIGSINISQSNQTTQSDRFDRQNRAYGIESTHKLHNGKVIIMGPICDLTYEIAKNLALSGLNHILFGFDNNFDNQFNPIDQMDHFKPGQVHLLSPELFLNEILKLNPYMKIELVEYYNVNLLKQKDNVCIWINPSIDQQELIKHMDPSNKFIYFWISQSQTKINFKLENDFGSHTVIDSDGENYELLALANIIFDELKIQIQTTTSHNLVESNLINIKLDNLPNTKLTFRVGKVIDSTTFEISNDKESNKDLAGLVGLSTHSTNGYVCRQKEQIILSHKPIKPNQTKIFNQIKKLNPLVQYYCGGLISSETIKAITSKYMPFDQIYNFDYDFDVAFRPDQPTQTSLNDLKCFIVGAGAIGCELLKNLVSIGVGINDGSYIKITDPDHIEVSNLSRQFLFGISDVGKSKSYIASQRIKQFEPLTKIINFDSKLIESNQEFVNSNWPDLDLVFNALDNLNARLYVDSQCVKFTKPLFESGTMGTKANTQVIIPHLTESYSDSQDQPQTKSFPACTIKNFPTLISHTIHWAMDDFDGLFSKQPQMLKQYIDAIKINDFTYFDSLLMAEQNVLKNNLKRLINKLVDICTINGYINWAIEIFNERFVDRIKRLLINHPMDSLTEDGKMFWSNGKKCPQISNFDFETRLNYISSLVYLLVQTYNMADINYTYESIFKLVSDQVSNLDRFNIKTTYCDDPDLYEELEFYPHQISNQISKVKFRDLIQNLQIQPLEFEKDDDSNQHIMLIQSTSNLRASNYNIEPASFYETKGIAGRIIPALATTTSIVASLITIQMFKYIQSKTRPISDYACTFLNLANNLILDSEPLEPVRQKINSMIISKWGILEPTSTEQIDSTSQESKPTSLESSLDMILTDFIKYWSEKFSTNIDMILAGPTIIYMEGFNESNLDKKIRHIINSSDDCLSLTSSETEVILPDIRLV